MNQSNRPLATWLDKTWRFFSSKALTLYLLGLLGAYYLTLMILTGSEVTTLTLGIDIWVSQGGDLPSLLGTNLIAGVFAFVLIFNLTCRIIRSLRNKDAALLPGTIQDIDQNTVFQQRFHTVMNFTPRKMNRSKWEAVIKLLKAQGLAASSVQKDKGWRLYARRGQVIFWAKSLFKVGLLLLLSGILLSMMTRITGGVRIGEGEVIDASQTRPEPLRYSWTIEKDRAQGASLSRLPWDYVKVDYIDPALNERFLPTSKNWIFAHRFRAEFMTGTITPEGQLETLKNPVELGVYPPVDFSGYSLFLYQLGVGPEIRIQDRSGREIYRSLHFLNLYPVGAEDSLEIPGFPYSFSLKIVTGTVLRKGEKIISHDLREPIYILKIFQGKKKVYEWPVRTGETISFDDYLISIPQTSFWTRIGIVKDRFLSVAFGGILLSLLGLLLWFLLKIFVVQEELFLVLEPEGKYDRLYLGMKGEWLKGWWTARSFRRLARGMDEVLGGEIEQDI